MLFNIIRKIKSLTIDLIVKFSSFYFYFKFHKKTIVVFDIDNTICDTWPLFIDDESHTSKVWATAKPFENMISIILSYQRDGFEIIYLSARPLSAKKLTKKWLIDNKLPYKNIYLTSTADKKIQFLSSLKNNFDYYDDLSYNSELGNVKFYYDVIDFVQKRENIQYFGYYELLSFKTGDKDETYF